jgi:hypothetical protein
VDSRNNSPAFTFHPRRQEKVETRSPGPGAYDSEASVIKDRVVSYKMGQSKRSDVVSSERRDQPGPGQYDHAHKTIKENDS